MTRSNRGGRDARGRGRGRGAAISGPMDALLGRGPVGALAVPDGLHYRMHHVLPRFGRCYAVHW